MPSPEHGGGPPRPDQPQQPEPEPVPYHRVARFAGERPAGDAYFAAQDALFAAPDVDLSVYRFQLDRRYHVAVLGDPPPADLDQTLTDILAVGEPADLPAAVLQQLAARRAQAIRQG